MIDRDLESFGRVRQPVDLIEDDHAAGRLVAPEELRLLYGPPHPKQLAIEVSSVGELASERRLADAPDAGQPDERARLECLRERGQPVAADAHATMLS